MNEFCTCGAKLPPDAQFCHKCGKPQIELPVPETQEPQQLPPAPVVTVPAVPTGVTWRNPAAVRSAAVAGSVVSFLLLVPLPPIINVLWMFLILTAGGFWAVHLFRKRTGSDISVGSGARLGWMVGVFCFLVLLVVFTLNAVLITTFGELREAFVAAFRASGTPEVASEYERMLDSPGGLAGMLAALVVTSFLMLPLFSTIGGALGAKILEKE